MTSPLEIGSSTVEPSLVPGPRPADLVRATRSGRDDRTTRQAKRIDERGGQVVEDAIERLTGQGLRGEQVQEPCLSLPAGRPVPFRHGARDHPTDQQCDHEEDHERDHVVSVVHAEGMERLGEEVVQEQEAEHRAADPRPDPSGDRSGHDGEQEQRRGAELVLGLNDQGDPERQRRGQRPRSRPPGHERPRRAPAPTVRS